MILKQKISVILSGILLILAAGTIETLPLVSFICLIAIGAAVLFGGLDKKRTSIEQIQREHKR